MKQSHFQINVLHQDRAKLSQDYARVAAERAGAIEDRAELERTVRQLKEEAVKHTVEKYTFTSKPPSASVVPSSSARSVLTLRCDPASASTQPDTPPQSPVKVHRRLSSFSNGGGESARIITHRRTTSFGPSTITKSGSIEAPAFTALTTRQSPPSVKSSVSLFAGGGAWYSPPAVAANKPTARPVLSQGSLKSSDNLHKANEHAKADDKIDKGAEGGQHKAEGERKEVKAAEHKKEEHKEDHKTEHKAGNKADKACESGGAKAEVKAGGCEKKAEGGEKKECGGKEKEPCKPKAEEKGKEGKKGECGAKDGGCGDKGQAKEGGCKPKGECGEAKKGDCGGAKKGGGCDDKGKCK